MLKWGRIFISIGFLILVLAARAAIALELEGVPEDLARSLKSEFPEAFSTRPSQAVLDDMIRYLVLTDRFEDVGTQISSDGSVMLRGSTRRTIRRIKISGNTNASRAQILDLLGLDESEPYERRGLEQGKKKLKQFYRQNGFADAKIEFDANRVGEDRIDLKILIDEGPSCRIEKIVIETENKPLQSRLFDEVRFLQGRIYTEETKQRISDRMDEFFRANRYLKTRFAEPKAQFNETRSLVTISYKLEDPYRYELDITGNATVPLPEILRAIDLDNYDRNNLDPSLFIVEKIREKYLNSGYPEVRVSVSEKVFSSLFVKRLYLKIEERNRVKIKDLRIEGRISRPSSFYINFIRDNSSPLIAQGFYNKRDLEIGFENLQTELKNQGFLKARVLSARFEFNRNRSGVVVTVIVDEGPLTLISAIDFEGNQSFSSSVLNSVLTLKVNAPLRLNQIESNIRSLTSFYQSRGYLEMKVLNEDRSLVTYNEENTQASLRFKIYEGPQVKVGSILLEGNEKTKNYVILRQLDFKVGDLLTPEAIQMSLTRLQKLNLFNSVDIRTMEEGTMVETRTVLVRVYEGNPGLFNVGMGISNELGVTLRGFTGIGYRNLGGTGRGVSGRVELSSNVSDVNFLEHKVNVGYLEPFLFNSRNRGRVNGIRYQDVKTVDGKGAEQEVLVEESNRLEFLVERDLNAYTKFSWLLWSIDSQKLFERNDKRPESKVQIGAIGPLFEIDRRDNPLMPTKGTYFNVGVEYANPEIGSSELVHYIRSTAGYTFYQRLGTPRWVWANSFRTGYIANLSRKLNSGIPVSRAFFLGGDTTIRGFDQSREQERIPDGKEIPVESNKILLVPKGREYFRDSHFHLFKSEIRFPIYKDFGGAIFYDGGIVQVTGVRMKDPYRDAIGFGLRYNTPLGPIRADVGFKLDRHDGEKGFLHYITIGTF